MHGPTQPLTVVDRAVSIFAYAVVALDVLIAILMIGAGAPEGAGGAVIFAGMYGGMLLVIALVFSVGGRWRAVAAVAAVLTAAAYCAIVAVNWPYYSPVEAWRAILLTTPTVTAEIAIVLASTFGLLTRPTTA